MEITKKQLLKSKCHSLRMKDLRKFVEKHKDIDDDVPVVVERVEGELPTHGRADGFGF